MKVLNATPVLFVDQVERHATFRGADELTFEEPGGNLVAFAKITRLS